MFFKKRETEIDDDFDNDDDFDDFDLDAGGFDDATPKTGARQAISTIKGGFFSGIKSSFTDPTMHRRVLHKSLPEGYVSHYDDLRDLAATSKSIYNTAEAEARTVAKAYAAELQPTVKAWDQKKQSKFSARVAKLVGGRDEEVGDAEQKVSASQMAYNNAANDIFGNSMAQATAEGIQGLATQTTKANMVGQGLQQQSNELMAGMSNTLHAQSAFNEQVALKWKKKTLEIQYKQYFTARKQLDVQKQSHEYLVATLPTLVKNTALPDLVKTQTSELAGQMLSQKWIGTLTDKAHDGIGSLFGEFGENLKTKAKDAATSMVGNSGMLGTALGMFNNDDGFGQSPKDMILEALGGFAASEGMNYLIDKGTGKLKEKLDGSGVDVERHNQNIKLLKHQVPAILAKMGREGTNNPIINKLFEWGGMESLTASRNTVIQSSLENNLQDQALFDLETKKSITFTIPGLLSEIHGELSTVRSGLGFKGPASDDKLRMDWTTGQLNTRGNIKKNLDTKLFGQDRRDRTDTIVYDMLGEMGFNKKDIMENRVVYSDDGSILLDSKDLDQLAAAIKAASYDNTEFFEISELAAGSMLVADPQSRTRIASFFTDQLDINSESNALKFSGDILADKRASAEAMSNHQIKLQNDLLDARALMRSEGVNEDAYKRNNMNVDLMAEQGYVTYDKYGNASFDAFADAQRIYEGHTDEGRGVSDMFRGDFGDQYGAQARRDGVVQRQDAYNAKKAKEAEELKAAKDAEVKEEYEDNTITAKIKRATEKAGAKAGEIKKGVKEVKATAAEVAALALTPEQLEHLKNGTTAPVEGEEEDRRTRRQKFDDINYGEELKKRGDQVKSVYNTLNEQVNTFSLGMVKTSITGYIDLFRSAAEESSAEREENFKSKIVSEELEQYDAKAFATAGSVEGANFRFKSLDGKRLGPKPPKPRLNPNPTVSTARVTGRPVESGLNDTQKNESVELAAEVATLAQEHLNTSANAEMARFATNQRKYRFGPVQPDAEDDVDNLFFGGTVGRAVRHYAKGGTIKFNALQDKIVKNMYGKLDALKPKKNDASPIKQAWDKEASLGGKPQVVVASEGEEILSNANGDAETFRTIKDKGYWDKIKTQIRDPDVDHSARDQALFAAIGINPDGSYESHSAKAGSQDTILGAFRDVIKESKTLIQDKTQPLVNDIKIAAKDFNKEVDDTNVEALSDSEFMSWMDARMAKTKDRIKNLDMSGLKLHRGKSRTLTHTTGEDGEEGGISYLNKGKEKVKSTAEKFKGIAKGPANMLDDELPGIGGSLEQMEGISGSYLNDAMTSVKGKFDGVDQAEIRAKLVGGLLGIKDFSSDKMGELGGAIGNISMPSMGAGSKPFSVMSYQLAEMIRLTGHIAINTGSDSSDLTPTHGDKIKPFDVNEKGEISLSSGGGNKWFSNFKNRFKRSESEDTAEGEVNPKKASTWSRFKTNFKDNWNGVKSDEEQTDEDEEGSPREKKGLLRRMAGGAWGGTKWGVDKYWKGAKIGTKLGWGATKGIGRGAGAVAKLGLKGAAATGRGLFGSVDATTDVYLEGEDKPIMLARDMAKEMYFDQATGDPILKAEDIKGAVVDANGTYLITDEDWNNRRVVTQTKEGTKSLFVRGASTVLGAYGTATKFTLKTAWAIASAPFKFALKSLNTDVDHSSGGYIDKDIYVKGDPEPRIRAKLIGKGEYFTADKESVETYNQLADGVYDKNANLIIDNADIKKGLTTPDGTPLGKLMGATGTAIGFGLQLTGKAVGAYYKATKATLRFAGSLISGGFNLVTGAGKGLWNRLRGKSNGTEADELLIEAQAATVDKLESIRIILDERMAVPEKAKHNDKDGDGVRDGSFLDQMKAKLAARKEKADAKKQKDKEKMEGISSANDKKSLLSGLADSVTSGISGFFSKGLMFAALGGLVAANFGPQIATGIFTGIRSVLPRWLGGYSDEKKAEIKANGGIIKNMMAAGSAAAEDGEGNRVGSQPQVDAEGNPLPEQLDENGNPIPSEEGTGGGSGLSTGTKFALGAAAMAIGPGRIIRGAGKGLLKAPGLAATGVRLASNKVGLTARMGLSGMGKLKATGHMVKGTARLAMRGGGALRSAVATNGIRGAAMAGLKALPALAASPIGMFVIGAVAVGLVAYAGYKLYKHLTKKDNHLTTFRMAQYGYPIKDAKTVTKILDLEQYMDKFVMNATASSSSKISTQASAAEAIKIFGIDVNNKPDVDKFYDWYYYRFKPVYLSWKTLLYRAQSKTDLGKIDELLYLKDKLQMVDDAHFKRDEQNPYNTPMSPIPGVEEVDYTQEDVINVMDKVTKQLTRINPEKHDAKIKTTGGGPSGLEKKDAAGITNMTASAEVGKSTEREREQSAKKEEIESRKNALKAKAGADKETQGWLSKFMFGDKKKKESGELSWGEKLNKNIAGFFGVGQGGDGGSGGTYDASSKTLNLSQQDIQDITKVTSTEAAEHLDQNEYNRQAGAIVDTIINRVISKGYPDTVRGVINQKSQFSQISGNRGAYGSVQAMPDNAIKSKARAFVPGYLSGRVDGSIKPVINGDLNYLNPAHSGAKAMRTWGKIIKDQAEKSGQIYGKGDSLHYHGTSTEMLNKKPFGFKLAMGGKTSNAQGSAGGPKPDTGVNGTNSNSIIGPKGIPNTSAAGTGAAPPAATSAVPKTDNSAAWKDKWNATSKPADNTAAWKDKWNQTAPVKGGNAMGGGSTATIKPGVIDSIKAAGAKVVQTHKEIGGAMSAPAQGSPKDITRDAKADGNLVAPEMTKSARPAKAVAYAMKKANKDSVRMCAQYVREALKYAGYSGMAAGNGCPSAYMYATTGHLVKNGFTEIPMNSQPQLGDVGVTSAPPGKVHGHIAIFNGSRWVSDFVHNHANPYSNKSLKGWLFRDSQFMNGAPPSAEGEYAQGGEGGEGSYTPAPGYKTDTNAAKTAIAERQAKRKAVEAAQANKYVSKESSVGFSGNGRGRDDIGGAPAKSDKSAYTLTEPKIKIRLGKEDIAGFDMTPGGYVPKVRDSQIKLTSDVGLTGNSNQPVVKVTKPDTAAEPTETTNAARIRANIDKQQREQSIRLEQKRQSEIISATEQRATYEKQQKVAESDSGIAKQQLEVQISMARDIRRMAEAMDRMQTMSPSNDGQQMKNLDTKEMRTVKPAQMNKHTQTIATLEPVSMKIN